MEEKYYLVRQRVHESENPSKLHVLVKVSDEGLNNVTGDPIIFSFLELENNQPTINERAICEYDIVPLKNISEYSLRRAAMEGEACGTEEWRSHRNNKTKTITMGRI